MAQQDSTVAVSCRTGSRGGVPLYENLVIGNFLFGLGIKVGARHDEMFTPGFGLHLMQQTPLDIVLGDVLLTGPRAVALLEFKRAADKSSKERGKLEKLKALLGNVTFEALQETSRRVHFYVETEDFVEKGFSRVLPYLDLAKDSPGSTLEELVDVWHPARAGHLNYRIFRLRRASATSN